MTIKSTCDSLIGKSASFSMFVMSHTNALHFFSSYSGFVLSISMADEEKSQPYTYKLGFLDSLI